MNDEELEEIIGDDLDFQEHVEVAMSILDETEVGHYSDTDILKGATVYQRDWMRYESSIKIKEGNDYENPIPRELADYISTSDQSSVTHYGGYASGMWYDAGKVDILVYTYPDHESTSFDVLFVEKEGEGQ